VILLVSKKEAPSTRYIVPRKAIYQK
jgi:hypothetical protein